STASPLVLSHCSHSLPLPHYLLSLSSPLVLSLTLPLISFRFLSPIQLFSLLPFLPHFYHSLCLSFSLYLSLSPTLSLSLSLSLALSHSLSPTLSPSPLSHFLFLSLFQFPKINKLQQNCGNLFNWLFFLPLPPIKTRFRSLCAEAVDAVLPLP